MLLVDASVVILSCQESLPMAQSVTKLLPRATQDYTHRVMTTVLVLAGVQCISTWLSYHLRTVSLWLQGTVMSQ